MPNIKIQDRSQGIGFVEETKMQEQNLTPKIADTSGAWGTLAKAGENVSDVALNLVKADQTVKAQRAKLEYDSAVDKLNQEMMQRTDWQDIPADHLDRLDTLKKEFQEKYPSVWNRVEPYAVHKAASSEVHVNGHINKLHLGEIRADYLYNTNELTKQYALSPEGSPQREGYRRELVNQTDYLVSTGAIQADDGKKIVMQIDNKADLYMVGELIRTNPELAKATLMQKDANGMPVNFKNLTLEQYGHALVQADQQEKTKLNEWHTEQNRLQHDTTQEMYRLVMDKSVPDAEKIAKIEDAARTPNAKGQYALDGRTALSMKHLIQNGEVITTDLSTFQNLYQRTLPTPGNPEGTLTLNDVNAAVASGLLSKGDARMFSTRVMSAEAKGETTEQKMIKSTLGASLKELDSYLDSYVMSGGDSESLRTFKKAVNRDALMVSDWLRTPSDVKWFKETYIPQVKAETAKASKDDSYQQDYVKKLKDMEDTGYWSKTMSGAGKTPKSADVYQQKGTGVQGIPDTLSMNVQTHAPLISRYFPENTSIMAHIMQAESGGRAGATQQAANVTKNADGTQTKDWGLYQINDVNIPALKSAGIIKKPEDLLDPETNVKAAQFLYKKAGLAPWRSSFGTWGDPVATDILRSAGKKVTPDNIKYVKNQLMGGK